jgi:hypothetical protein
MRIRSHAICKGPCRFDEYRSDLIHEAGPHEIDRHVLARCFFKAGLVVSKCPKCVATSDLARAATAILPRSCGLVCAHVPMPTLLRKSMAFCGCAFKDEQIAALRKLNKSVAWRGIAAEQD